MNIETQLEQYADLLERQEMMQKQMQELLDKVPVPKEIVEQWDAIKAEFQPMINSVKDAVEEVKEAIEENVLTIGSTAKGSRYMAVYVSGRKSWDGHKLEGYAMDHPEILQAQKTGEPTVTFRKVK